MMDVFRGRVRCSPISLDCSLDLVRGYPEALDDAIERADEAGRERPAVELARNEGWREGVGEGGAGRLDESDRRPETLDRGICAWVATTTGVGGEGVEKYFARIASSVNLLYGGDVLVGRGRRI